MQDEWTNFGPKKSKKETTKPKPTKLKEEKKETNANRVKDVDIGVNEEEFYEVDTTR